MDAVKFIEERNRMCKSFDKYCYGCPAWDGLCKLEPGSYLKCEAVMAVKIVEEWSAAHPRRTRQDVFLEQWPEANIGGDGVLQVCPSPIFPSARNADNGCVRPNSTCSECRREFWMQEVE